MNYAYVMETLVSLAWLLAKIGGVVVVFYLVMKAIPKNDDPTKRSVMTIFGKPLDFSFGPFQATTAVGYIEAPLQFQIRMPTTIIESKDDPPLPMEVRDWNYTLQLSRKTPANFLRSGGQDEVTREVTGMLTAGLQEFSANNTRFATYQELKKAQPWMTAAIINYIHKGEYVDLDSNIEPGDTDEEKARKIARTDKRVEDLHDKLASKLADIELAPLGVTIIQMDIGRIVEPAAIIEVNTAVAEQQKENDRRRKEIEGVAERLKLLQGVDPTATLKDLQVQEGIRPATLGEQKVVVEGVGEADKLIGGIIAATNALANNKGNTK